MNSSDYVLSMLSSLEHLPWIGPLLVKAMTWIGIVSAILTPLSFCVQVILRIPEIAARFSGAPALADKIKYWSDKIIYWVSFFSIRNAKK